MLRDFWNLAKPFWNSEEQWKARGLGVLVLLLTLTNVYVMTRLTYYNGEYGDAIQQKDLHRFLIANAMWLFWALIGTSIYVYQTYFQQALLLRWRKWMTRHFLQTWLTDRTFYYWRFAGTQTDNPDQRISEDVRDFIDNTLNLVIGLVQQCVTLITYSIILWNLSGVLPVSLGAGRTLKIHGYLVIIAYLWSLFSSWITWLVGRRLVSLNASQQRFEADFRFGMVRVRENSESIALGRGEQAEDRTLQGRFANVAGNFQKIMQKNKQVNAVTYIASAIGGQASYFLAGPLYFKGVLSYGDLIKINSSFYQVQNATFFFVNSYTQIALWQAIIRRLTEFNKTAMQAKEVAATKPLTHEGTGLGGSLAVSDLSLSLPDGRLLSEGLDMSLSPGDSLLVMGPSGVGKSTLLRAISGIWPFAEGGVQLPTNFEGSAMVLPQKPYLPIGTLRAALSYPIDPAKLTAVKWPDLLRKLHLENLIPRLDDEENWSQILSGGEQQRVAFARVFLQKPRWLFLDESTSALDEATESALYDAVQETLPETAILSIGHRNSLVAHHATQFVFSAGAPTEGMASEEYASEELVTAA